MMIYTIISDDMQSYDLPGKTLKVMEKIEALQRDDARKDLSIREKYKKVNVFVVDILGKDVAKELLGTDKLDEMDLSVLTITAKKIIDAYDKPLDDYNSSKVQQTIAEIPLDKVTELIKATDSIKDKR
jgi:hypothetical protein